MWGRKDYWYWYQNWVIHSINLSGTYIIFPYSSINTSTDFRSKDQEHTYYVLKIKTTVHNHGRGTCTSIFVLLGQNQSSYTAYHRRQWKSGDINQKITMTTNILESSLNWTWIYYWKKSSYMSLLTTYVIAL